MNVLVLTPDRVGSTLLQRLITIHMQSHDFGKPVINIHELTNGLTTGWNSKLNNTTIRRNAERWGYYQSLQDIVEMLESADHFKTARLAHYHIKNRADSVDQQQPFYQYINDNFFIISARRENLLEHALSWCIFTVSKKLNVYGPEEKISTFRDIYKNKIHVDQDVMIRYLDAYVDYIKWTENHFNVSSYFEYGRDLPQIENYINNLNLFGTDQKNNFWQNIFGMTWQDWNRCHYLVSDLSTGSDNLSALPWVSNITSHQLLPAVMNTASAIQTQDRAFLTKNIVQYLNIDEHIQDMVRDGTLASGVPIKLQTMLEKRFLVQNFDQCVDTYNRWCQRTGHGTPVEQQALLATATEEMQQWHAPGIQSLLGN
jgi:hypothetical protein